MNEIKFGQTVYIIQDQCMNHPGRRIVGFILEYEKRVMSYRVVAFDDTEAYLEGGRFVKREELFIDGKKAEKELKKIKKEEWEKEQKEMKRIFMLRVKGKSK